MDEERSRYGLLVSALGAILLAISVYLPWYGLKFTASGIASAQQLDQQAISSFGNATLQSYSGQINANLDGLAGHELLALNAHQIFKYMSIALLVIAGLALLDVLVPLTNRAHSIPDGAGGASVLLGALAAIYIVFRMIDPPGDFEGALSLSLREGAWLALLGAVAMVLGGMWPRVTTSALGVDPPGQGVWSALSGWTPEV
jgi:hypothetical protein